MADEKQPWNFETIERGYAFFNDAERTGRRFTMEDITKEIGYKLGTAESYRTKKWYWFLQRDGDEYFCQGLHRYSKQMFVFIHQQKISVELLEQLIVEEIARTPKKARHEKNGLALLLFLLMCIGAWYQFTRRYYFKIGWLRLPL